MQPQTIWRPCTQMKDIETYPLIRIARGEGAELIDEAGNRYIDAISSWWVNLFGHANPRIARAVAEQAGVLEHVIFAGCSHRPGEELAERLVALMPEKLTKVFFADNGSAAVEVAMKMSFGLRKNSGEAGRKRYIYLQNGYHGETLGALSVCGDELYSATFSDIMMDNIQVQSPDCYRCPFGLERNSCHAPCFAWMQDALEKHAAETTAVIVEPLVQCAGGFRMYPPVYLKKLRTATRALGIHLIVDEIATGFGRTGTMFAIEQAGITPDFVCVSKGITGGFLPLSAVVTTDAVYDSFYADYTDLKAFLHSHSYTGNPIACAAALATLDIFRDDDVIRRNRDTFDHLHDAVCAELAEHPHVGEIRRTGCIIAAELVKDKLTKEPFDWKARTGFQIYRKALPKGALLRNLGDIVYFMPPYIITPEQSTRLARIAGESLREVLG